MADDSSAGCSASTKGRKRYPWPDAERYHGFSTPTMSSAVNERDVRFIYFLQQGDLVKVGMAKDVKARLESFRLGSPRGLSLRGTREVPGPLVRQVERKIHTALAEWSVGREWFRTTPAHAREAAAPIIKAAFKAHRQYQDDGFWTRGYEPPPAPPEAMACGLLPPEISEGVVIDEPWIERLIDWRPELPQAAAFLAIDLPKLFAAMPQVSVSTGEGTNAMGDFAMLVDFDTGGWFSANDILAASIEVPTIKHMHYRWERRGIYGFEVPKWWVELQTPAMPPFPPSPPPPSAEGNG